MISPCVYVGLDSGHISLGTFFDASQLMPPEALEGACPLMEGPDGLRIGAIDLVPTVATQVNQAHVSQDAEVL
jgi:hypothetical protein